MSTTPTTFTIQNTGIYRMTDGSAAYWFEAGTIIPMYLAIALGIEGAGYDPVPVFNSDQTAAINALINASGGGGGGGATFPMAEGVWYDNRTATAALTSAGPDGSIGPGANDAFAGLVCLTEDATVSKVGIMPAAPDTGTTTFRLALYEVGDGALCGEKVGDLATIAVVDDFSEDYAEAETSLAVSAGYYWIVVAADAAGDVGFFEASSGLLGATDAGDPISCVEISVTGIGAAMPSTLVGETQSRSAVAPLVLFQITHD